MEECVKHECYYYNSRQLIDNVLEYFQENEGSRCKEFEEWKANRAPNNPLHLTPSNPQPDQGRTSASELTVIF